jgi:hypothetical protein
MGWTCDAPGLNNQSAQLTALGLGQTMFGLRDDTKHLMFSSVYLQGPSKLVGLFVAAALTFGAHPLRQIWDGQDRNPRGFAKGSAKTASSGRRDIFPPEPHSTIRASGQTALMWINVRCWLRRASHARNE